MATEIIALFRKLTLRVYIVGVAHGAKRDAFTAASIMPTSYRPLMLALAINPVHASYDLLRAGQTFTVSVLSNDQIELARRFGSEAPAGNDKMHGIDWRNGRQGAPILQNALAFFECAVRADTPAGDHRLILGQVGDGALLRPDARPLAYADTGNLDRSAGLYPRSFET